MIEEMVPVVIVIPSGDTTVVSIVVVDVVDDAVVAPVVATCDAQFPLHVHVSSRTPYPPTYSYGS